MQQLFDQSGLEITRKQINMKTCGSSVYAKLIWSDWYINIQNNIRYVPVCYTVSGAIDR